MLAGLDTETASTLLWNIKQSSENPLLQEAAIFSDKYIDANQGTSKSYKETYQEEVECPETSYGRGAGFYGQRGGGSPGVGAGDPIVLGALDKSLIDRVVKSHLAQIRYCYQRELAKNPKLFGKIVVKFIIAKDGTVSSATTQSSTMNNPVCESCITSRFLRMRFPAPKGGGIVTVSYPFVFTSQGG